MLTTNAKNFLLYGLMNSSKRGTETPIPSLGFALINNRGTERTVNATYYNVSVFVNALNNMSTAEGNVGRTYIKCGTGTTETTEDDYNLEAENTDLSCDSVATAISSNDTKTYTATFSNATDTDITVTEIGFFINTYYYGNSDNDKFLLDRIVLDTPITIPAGESKPFTYEIGF